MKIDEKFITLFIINHNEIKRKGEKNLNNLNEVNHFDEIIFKCKNV